MGKAEHQWTVRREKQEYMELEGGYMRKILRLRGWRRQENENRRRQEKEDRKEEIARTEKRGKG